MDNHNNNNNNKQPTTTTTTNITTTTSSNTIATTNGLLSSSASLIWSVEHSNENGTIGFVEETLQFKTAAKTKPMVNLPYALLPGYICQYNVKECKVRIQAKSTSPLQFQFQAADHLQAFVNTFQKIQDQYKPPKLISPPTPTITTTTTTEPSTVMQNSHSSSLSISHPLPAPKEPEKNISTQVLKPERVILNGESYVVYTVTTRSNMVEYQSKDMENNMSLWNVRHRFKDFEILREALVNNHPRAAVPVLPKKMWMNKFNSGFVESRTQELDKFLQEIATNPNLIFSPHLRKFLTEDPHKNAQPDILTEDQQSKGYFETYIQDNPITCVMESTITEVFAQKKELMFKTQLEQDYETMKQLMKKWEVTPQKLPFEKFLVLVLGTTSAGKSSWVNHFFGITCKKAADCQQDIIFTLVETVPSTVFNNIVNNNNTTTQKDNKSGNQFPNFTDDQLQKNIEDIYSDPRYGKVFVVLNTTSTLNRYYTQLAQFSAIISRYALFQTVLINEHYLHSNRDTELLKRTILIDSPGFSTEKLGSELLESFLGNLKMLQALYSLSDITLFFMPATQLNLISNQLSILELSIILSVLGTDKMESILQSPVKSEENESIFTAILKKLGNKNLGQSDNDFLQTTAVWEKVLFILSKVDLLTTNEEALRYTYYELGGLMRKSFTHLPIPVPDNILTLSLPEKSVRPTSCNINLLRDKIKALSQFPFEKRVEKSVQDMCIQLKKLVAQSWTKYFSYDITEIDKVLERSRKRTQNLQ